MKTRPGRWIKIVEMPQSRIFTTLSSSLSTATSRRRDGESSSLPRTFSLEFIPPCDLQGLRVLADWHIVFADQIKGGTLSAYNLPRSHPPIERRSRRSVHESCQALWSGSENKDQYSE